MAKVNKGKQGGRTSKNETILRAKSSHFKLSQRGRFALRWLLAYSGARDLTQLLEELIEEKADETCRANPDLRHWQTLYHPDDAVAMLRLLAMPRYRPTPKERDLYLFVRANADFFYDSPEKVSEKRASVLWPKIDEYAAHWHETQDDRRWATAKIMANELKKHGEPIPEGDGRW